MADGDDLTRAHLWISGLVQGVFFRTTTARQARSRRLTGWIRNAPDGRVEAEFQGSRPAVEQIIEECRAGPPMASVTDVEVDYIDPVEDEERFRVVA